MKEVLKVLAKGEAERMGFLDKRHEINARCEVTWLRLKEAAMKGVIDSFNVASSIEGPAGMAEGMWKGLETAYTHRAMISTQDFMNALTVSQRQEIMYGMCGDCHCARKNSEFIEPPRSIKSSKKYCSRGGRCHRGGDVTDKTEAKVEFKADPDALAMVDEIRKARPDQLDAVAGKILRKYPDRGKQAGSMMVGRMKGEAGRFMNQLCNMSKKDMRNKTKVNKFKQSCGSNGCHSDIARSRSPRKLMAAYVARVKKNTGMTTATRMNRMFRGVTSMDGGSGKSKREKELAQVHEFMKMVRRLLPADFRERKDALSEMVKGESELRALSKLVGNDGSKMMLIMRPKKTKSMYTKYVLDQGRAFNIMAEMAGLSDRDVDKLIRSVLKPQNYELSDDIMFDMQARIKAGTELYQMRCGVCHSIEKPGTAIKSRDEWAKTIKKMKHMSYNLAGKEAEVICDYLSQRNEEEEG